jgi:TatD DNase family protein
MAHRVPDVHCHLDALPDPAGAVEEAAAAGVGPILAVGMRQASSERALLLRARFPGRVLAAVGLHPSEIPALDAATLELELAFVRQALPRADALGEVGLDYKDAATEDQRERQRVAFLRQLEWAAQFRKPVSVHSRRADREVLDRSAAFARSTGLGVNLHWFTHSAKLAQACAAAGLFISPGPSILHDDSQARVAAAIDPDWLLLETDSPVEFGGEPARPAWAARVAARLAALRGEEPAALAARLQANFQRYRGAGACC